MSVLDIDADRVNALLDQATPVVADIREYMALPPQQENLLGAALAKDGGIRLRDYVQRNLVDMVRGYGNLTPSGQESIVDAALTQDGGQRLKQYIQHNVLEPADATATPYRIGMVASLIFVGLCLIALILTLILLRRSEIRKQASFLP